MSTFSDLVTDAIIELRSARAGDVVNPDDMDLGLRTLNRLFDSMNADEMAIYNEAFTDYTLTPNLSPHTIGPGGTFSVTQRPVSLDYAALNLGGTTPVFTRINVRDDAWYQRQGVPSISITVPTDVYYDTSWPLGNLYFYGIPSLAYSVRLWTRTVLAAVALTDTFSLPPGYQNMLTLTLAEWLGSAFGQSISESTARRAKDARDLVYRVNDTENVNINTRDAGMPDEGIHRSGYEYLTGLVNGDY